MPASLGGIGCSGCRWWPRIDESLLTAALEQKRATLYAALPRAESSSRAGGFYRALRDL